MKNSIKQKGYKATFICLFIFALSLSSCDKYELPDTGTIADKTPPKADFSFAQGVGPNQEWKRYDFANLSTSATTYFWDFGDGNTSTVLDASNIFPGEGIYTITLKASDNLGVEDIITKTIEIIQPATPTAILPIIHEAGFEDNDSNCGPNQDGRDCWRISGGNIFGITSSPVRSGSQGAKFDAGSNRVAYQQLTVSPNTDYTITIHYTIKTSPVGSQMRLAVLGSAITNASQAEAAIFASVTGNDQTDANAYVPLTLTFNTGARSTIAIWIDSNNVAESRVDDVSIAVN